ncbi:MAG TPA: glycosyltransferase family 39 protein [Thermoanaerobaculia bacterium]
MKRLREWIPEIALVLASTAAGIRAGGRWLSPTSDAGIWWSLPERLASGERLYRDIFPNQYGPLSPYLVSWVTRPFAFSSASILIVSWIPAVIAAVLVLRLARPFLSLLERLCLAAILIGVGLFAPGLGRLVYPYSPAAVHALCLSLGALLVIRPPDESGALGWRSWVAGVLAGLAFCCKQEIGIVAAMALVASGLTMSSSDRPRGQGPWGGIARCLAGFAAPAVLGVLFVLTSAPLESLRLDSHVWPLAAPPPSWNRLFRLIAGIGPGLPGRLLDSLRGLGLAASLFALIGLLLARDSPYRPRRFVPVALVLAALLAWDLRDGSLLRRNLGFVHLWMTMAFTVALWAFLDRRRAHRDFLVGFGVFAGLLGARSAFSGDIANPYAGVSHLPGALALLLFLFVFLPEVWPPGGKPGDSASRFTRLVWAAVLFPVVCLGAAIGMISLRSPGFRPVDTPRGRIWADRDRADLYRRAALEIRPGERVLALPETNAVDVLFEARSASPFVLMVPGWLDPRAEELLIRRFEQEPPDVVVVFRRPTWEYGVAPFGQGFGIRLAEWIQTHNRLVATSPGGNLYRRGAPGKDAP